jgi:HD superfamily phosphohydrolase
MGNPYEGEQGQRAKVQTIRSTGAVELYGPEIDIVDTPEFQRLGGIKQLGTSYLVFRGAVHTRFEHSLGTLQEAQNIINAVNDNAARQDAANGRPRSAPRIDRRGIRLARLAALLHDLPHIPFGHTLEDEFHLLERHDENSERFDALLVKSEIGDLLRSNLSEDEFKDLCFVLGVPGKSEKSDPPKDEAYVHRLGEYAYVADIVANTVCADVLDYIVRDLSACGMPVAIGTRFLDFFEITPGNLPIRANRHRLALRLDKRGMPRPDVESEVLKLLSYRYELAERVFFHHAKNAASVMIGEAVALLGLHERDANFHLLSDDILLAALANHKVAKAIGLRITTDIEQRDRAEQIGKMIVGRRLYKLAYLGVADDDVSLKAQDIYARWGESAESRRALEAELAAKAGLEPGRVLVHLPSPNMMAKLAKVRVILGDDTVTTYEEWEGRHSERVQALNRAHARLWRVGVYIHPDDSRRDGGVRHRLVHGAARDLFELPSRYAQTEVEEPYLGAVYDIYSSEREWPVGDRDTHLRQAAAAAPKEEGPSSLQGAVERIDSVVKESTPGAAASEQTSLDDQ